MMTTTHHSCNCGNDNGRRICNDHDNYRRNCNNGRHYCSNKNDCTNDNDRRNCNNESTLRHNRHNCESEPVQYVISSLTKMMRPVHLY